MTSSELHSNGAHGREIWILRSDESQRSALVRLSGLSGPHVHAGSPGDPRFHASRGGANVGLVVLGVSGDPELELEYVHRNASRLPNATWIVVSDDRSDAELAAAFDALDATFIGPPVQAVRLRGAIAHALHEPEARDSLRLRRYRDALSERFARWFADLDLPELLRAMDPQLARVPIVLRGEPGTGRALLARYVHTFGGDAAGGQMPFVEILCCDNTTRGDLLRAIETSAGARNATLFLKELEALPPQVEVELRNWIEFGLPPGTRCASHVRWVAALAPEGSAAGNPCTRLDPDLLAVLSGLEVHLPPLRARRASIENFARATALAQSESTGRRPRDFSADALAALQNHTWPGNLRELESLLRRAFADSAADPLEARHLKLAGSPAGEAEPFAETWHGDSDEDSGREADPVGSGSAAPSAEDALPEAEILDERGDRDDREGLARDETDAEAPAPAEWLASELLGDARDTSPRVLSEADFLDDRDDAESDDEGEDEQANFERDVDDEEPEWLDESDDGDEDDEGERADRELREEEGADWIEAEPVDRNLRADAVGELVADDLDSLPSLEVRSIPRAEAAAAGLRDAPPTHGAAAAAPAAAVRPAALARVDKNTEADSEAQAEAEAHSLAWQRALVAICEELSRPIEAMRPLAAALQLHHIAPDFVDGFASEIAHDMTRARETSQRLAAIQASAATSSDVSQVLESLLAELRGEISRRGLLVLKELDRARPQALAPASALRFALRGLLARFVARENDAASSDLYIASHHNPTGLENAPSMRILIRHAHAPAANRSATDAARANDAASDAAERDLGIELALCHAVARAAGGALSVSDPGDGQIVVVIDLPAPA